MVKTLKSLYTRDQWYKWLSKKKYDPHTSHVTITRDPRSVISNFVQLHTLFNLNVLLVVGFNWSKNMLCYQVREMNRLYADKGLHIQSAVVSTSSTIEHCLIVQKIAN